MGEIVKSVLMGLGCLTIMGFVGCSMMSAGVMVAADRAADVARDEQRNENGQRSPWDK